MHCFHCIPNDFGSSSTAGDTSSFGITVSFVRTKTAGATCSFDIAAWFSHTKWAEWLHCKICIERLIGTNASVCRHDVSRTKTDLVTSKKCICFSTRRVSHKRWPGGTIKKEIVLAAVTHYEDTLLYAVRFLRSDENIIFAAVMRSVRIFAAQDKRALWHATATLRISWFLMLAGAGRSA